MLGLLLWRTAISLLLLWVGAAAANYSILVISYPVPPYTEPDTIWYMDQAYLEPSKIDSAALSDPPSSANKYLFWDATSISFKMGAPCDDFGSQWVPAASIEAAVDAWDDIDPDSLSISYDGEDYNKTNDPDDGENVIFFGEHSSLGSSRGITMITAPTSGAEIGEFSDVDIVLNDAMRWTLNKTVCANPPDTSDVQSTTTHEVGHALGLAHVTGKHCMTPSQYWCSGGLEEEYEDLEQRIIQASDQRGYEYLYVKANSVRSEFGGGAGQKPIAEAWQASRTRADVVVFPNPFNPDVNVAFRVERTAVTSARIYNALGQEVRQLYAPQSLPPGHYQLVWDGRDADGQVMASGRYILRVAIGAAVHSYQLALVR